MAPRRLPEFDASSLGCPLGPRPGQPVAADDDLLPPFILPFLGAALGAKRLATRIQLSNNRASARGRARARPPKGKQLDIRNSTRLCAVLAACALLRCET